MDRQTYTAELASLRELRTEIGQAEKTVAAAQKELDKLTGHRSPVTGCAGWPGWRGTRARRPRRSPRRPA